MLQKINQWLKFIVTEFLCTNLSAEHSNGSQVAYIILERRTKVHDELRSGRYSTSTENPALVDTIKSVSYTHLDVYKRQGPYTVTK